MNRLWCIAALLTLPAVGLAKHHVVIVQGLGGDPVYSGQFTEQVTRIEAAARSLPGDTAVHVLRDGGATREAFLALFSRLAEAAEATQLTAYFIGHGSYDEHDYKFNLPGPDLTGADIAGALDEVGTDDIVVVNTSSASGALAELVNKDRRVVALATRSGSERHATRFGGFFAAALASDGADTDKNKTVSVGEAFRFAARQVADYFEGNGQLATEHPVLHGERADRFVLARLGKPAPRPVAGRLTALFEQRDTLSADIDALRLRRDELSVTDYQAQLMPKLVELARLEAAIEAEEEARGDD